MTTTRSQDHDNSTTSTGDKREAAEEHQDSHGKHKVRKVVVQKDKEENEASTEKGGEPKQQKLATEGGEKEEEKKEEDKVGEPTQEKGDSSARNDSKDESNLTSRQQAEKDEGTNAEPGEKPDLSHVSKEDFKRKHGILETGHVYFLFRPKVEVNEPHSLDDVSKFHLLLVPHHSKLHRLIAIGKKALPEQSGRPLWGEVLNVGEDMKSLKKNLGSYTYETKTMGTRHQPGARVAASGSYILHSTENYPKDSQNMSAVYQTHFAYQVALPHEMGEVQEALHIHPERVFGLQVKDPEAKS
ncbi:hypothetical protein JCM3765_004282, partial [Sporobolomyces pararoseus]